MKEHTDVTLTALIEAMHRNEPDTFIELVNDCHDLFGHDAAGHSLMWHARQSSNPVFAETLELLAAGRPFTEAAPTAPRETPEAAPSAAPSANKEEESMPPADSDFKKRTKKIGIISFFVLCFGVGVTLILHLWFSTIYTIAEYATYHHMPSIVNLCLPQKPKGLFWYFQRDHFERLHWHRQEMGWWKWSTDAFDYAVKHGDVASVRAYLRTLNEEQQINAWNECAKEFNLMPVREVLPTEYITDRKHGDATYMPHLVLDVFALEKQMSFDEPEMLEPLMKMNEDVCVDAMMKHNAQRDALWLVRNNGCNATYGKQGEKRTLLQAAVEYNNVDMIELLLKHGANPDFAAFGKTPRRMAEDKNRGDVLQLFNDFRYKGKSRGERIFHEHD